MLGSQSEHSDGGLEQPDIQLAQTNRAQVSTNLTNYSDQYLFFCLIESPNGISPSSFNKQLLEQLWRRWLQKSHDTRKQEDTFQSRECLLQLRRKAGESPRDFAKMHSERESFPLSNLLLR